MSPSTADVIATTPVRIGAVARDVRGRALDCGHSPQEEQPAQTAAALIDFVD